MTAPIAKDSIKIIPDEVLHGWQEIVDIMASILDIPAGLIMRASDDRIEVLVSSETDNNPYHPGDSEAMADSGLYCERVIKTRNKLLVPNALKDENWKNNPDIKFNMISYLGFPILYPDQSVFGTLCVLDSKENPYSPIAERLLRQLKKLIEANLAMVYMNQELGEENRNLKDYIEEIRTLRGIIPICTNCKKIRDDQGFWNTVEVYLSQKSDVRLSHSVCPECAKKLYGDKEWYKPGKGNPHK